MTKPGRISRRHWLKATAAAAAALAGASGRLRADSEDRLPPVRQITRGPKFHWFGYYDKREFDPSGRYVLGMEVAFENRSPHSDDVINIGMVDLEDHDRWIELGESRAWCWQQGCMAQWLPGSAQEIVWNDRQHDRFVCHILDVKTRRKRTLPQPIYAVSPDGRWAIAPSFSRLADVRPGYGYAGVVDPYREVLAPPETGIFRVDMETGTQRLLISLADVARIPFADQDLSRAKHWFNHLLINPDGTRFEFLHRWKSPEAKSFTTRMLTAAADGSDLRILDASGFTSHFIWRDPRHILAWTRQPGHGDGFYLFTDEPAGAVELIGKGVMTGNGHCSYLPGAQWILNDTYPDRQRQQHVYLYHAASGRRVPLGDFISPREYRDEWRCDTHPRFSPDGRSVVIDSPHTGQGRQLHLIDIRGIIAPSMVAGLRVA